MSATLDHFIAIINPSAFVNSVFILAYAHYYGLVSTSSGKTKLQKELVARWNAFHNQKEHIFVNKDGVYYSFSTSARRFIEEFSNERKYELRGANKARCLETGRPLAYHRTALFAVSVFHLSH